MNYTKTKNDSELNVNLSTQFFVELPLIISTYDIDIAGHVNNIVYIRWIEDLRSKLFSCICNFEEMIKSNFYFVVISTEIKYKKQLKFFDTPTGTMRINRFKHGILSLAAQIKINDNVSAVAEQRCVLVDLTTSKIASNHPLNEFLKRLENTTNNK